MAKKPKIITLDDLRYGQMNNLDPTFTSPSMDPRRTGVVQTMRRKNAANYTHDDTHGRSRWNAIVIKSNGPNKHPIVFSPFHRWFGENVPAGTRPYYTYQIFIIEHPRCVTMKIPDDYLTNPGFIGNLPTAIPAVGNPLQLGVISPNTPVEVGFLDQEKMRYPFIINVRDGKILLREDKGASPSSAQGRSRSTVGATSPLPEEQSSECPETLSCSPAPTVLDPNWLRCFKGETTRYPKTMGFGASYIHGNQTFAGDYRGLNIARVAKGGRQLYPKATGRYHDGSGDRAENLTVYHHLKKYIDEGCLDLKPFNRFVFFAGANATSSGTAWTQLESFIRYLKTQNSSAKIIVVTLAGWGNYKRGDKHDKPYSTNTRRRMMQKALDYNNSIRGAEGGLIDHVVDWEKQGTRGGYIKPGDHDHDWLKDEYHKRYRKDEDGHKKGDYRDGLHPNGAAHRWIASQVAPLL